MDINSEINKDIEELVKSSQSLQVALNMYIYDKITFHELNKIINQAVEKDNEVVKYNDDYIFNFDLDEKFIDLKQKE